MGNTLQAITEAITGGFTNVERIDLANWMGNLNETMKNAPITLIAIPGSHDSMSYSITKKSKLAPDAEIILHEVVRFAETIVRMVMFHWSVTQHTNVKQQLKMGIRYLDFRISKSDRPNDRDFYFVHGLFGERVRHGLKEINDYLNCHHQEIIIMDFHSFFNFTEAEHRDFILLLKKIFGQKLCPNNYEMSTVTINWMLQNNYRVIAIYRNNFGNSYNYLWTGNNWLTSLAETMDIDYLLEYLTEDLKKRSKGKGLISYCLLTPQLYTVLSQPFVGLEKICAIPVLKATIPWLRQQKTGTMNVAIADFVSLDHFIFPEAVVSLNFPDRFKYDPCCFQDV